MNRRDFLKFASAAPFAGVAAESFVATGVGEPCDYNVDVLVVGGGPAGAVRVMPPCMAMGQAAGTAAALCVKTGATPRALDASKLVATLREQKAFLG